MSKAFRILLIALLGLTASVWLGATGIAPLAATQVVMGEGSGSGAGMGYGSGDSYLGVDIEDVTKERMAALKLTEERGVEVLMVDQDAPAGKAGLKEHDVILDFNGARVEGVEQLRRMIHETPAGRSVTLGISRDGKPLTVTATLAARSEHYSFSFGGPSGSGSSGSGPKVFKMPKVIIPKIEMPEMEFVIMGSARSGLLVENLTPQLGEFFGVKDGAGVLVRSVEKGSPAETAGFKAGDVIVRVEQEKVADKGDWRSTMRSHRSGKVAIGIIRDRKEQTLSLALPESKDQSHVWRIETPDLDDLDNDLDQMDIEINRLSPQMEHLRDMQRMRLELNSTLSASLTQGGIELSKAMALAGGQPRFHRGRAADAGRCHPRHAQSPPGNAACFGATAQATGEGPRPDAAQRGYGLTKVPHVRAAVFGANVGLPPLARSS